MLSAPCRTVESGRERQTHIIAKKRRKPHSSQRELYAAYRARQDWEERKLAWRRACPCMSIKTRGSIHYKASLLQLVEIDFTYTYLTERWYWSSIQRCQFTEMKRETSYLIQLVCNHGWIYQLDLPEANKMDPPTYQEFPKEKVPLALPRSDRPEETEGKGWSIKVIAGQNRKFHLSFWDEYNKANTHTYL